MRKAPKRGRGGACPLLRAIEFLARFHAQTTVMTPFLKQPDPLVIQTKPVPKAIAQMQEAVSIPV